METAVQLNRAQLLKGLGSDGLPLSPKYSEDPYFKSKESALRYAAWKQKITPEAPFDTPTLFITGKTHDAIFAQVKGARFTIDSDVPWASDIDRKYNGKEFGLNEDSKQQYRGVLMPVARDIIRGLTGCR